MEEFPPPVRGSASRKGLRLVDEGVEVVRLPCSKDGRVGGSVGDGSGRRRYKARCVRIYRIWRNSACNKVSARDLDVIATMQCWRSLKVDVAVAENKRVRGGLVDSCDFGETLGGTVVEARRRGWVNQRPQKPA